MCTVSKGGRVSCLFSVSILLMGFPIVLLKIDVSAGRSESIRGSTRFTIYIVESTRCTGNICESTRCTLNKGRVPGGL
jgi:hypothetical protein